jgi:hypothetical protein
VKTGRILATMGAVAGAALGAVVGYAAIAWVRYGRVDVERHPRDELLDRFLPEPEVDEYHRIRVAAPASVTFAVAEAMDLQGSPLVQGIFWLRSVPSLLRGEPYRPEGSRGLLEETLSNGWGVLAEEPGREIVVGAYTQPWHQEVTFHALAPDRFAAFDEPGFAKIVWTLSAEPLGEHDSAFVTRTRVVTTDEESRRKFRLYWAPMSAGIILIRYAGLPLVKREAERRARREQAPATPSPSATIPAPTR